MRKLPPDHTDVETCYSIKELSVAMALPFHAAEKIADVLENRAAPSVVAWVPRWVSAEHGKAGAAHKDDRGRMQPVPDRYMVVRRIQDYSDKSWKVQGAYWLDSDVILDETYEVSRSSEATSVTDENCSGNSQKPGGYSFNDLLDQVDLTEEDWIDSRGVCWIPKDGTQLFAYEE